MINSMLRRNLAFVAGWVVAGLAIALLVNLLWREDRATLHAAAPATSAGDPAMISEANGAAPVRESHGNNATHAEPVPATPAAPATPVYSYSSAVRISAPAVVSVYTQTKVNLGNVLQRAPNGRLVVVPKEALLPGLGSGVIVDAQGHIITNEHVIKTPNERGAKDVDEIFVQLADGRHAAASVVGTDPGTDLAVLKIALEGLPVMPLGRADRVEVGDVVLAIGSPLGLSQTVTHGIVSAKGRAQVGVTTYENFIQTDAAINHGNSGGALVNVRGELIGINTASIKYQGSEGLGMAIPVDLVRGVMREILQNGRVVRGWLGLKLADVTEEYARQNKLPHHGVLIWELHDVSPAHLAGITIWDKIETLNGQPVRSGSEMMDRIVKIKPGSSVTIAGSRARNREPFSVELKVIEAPAGSQ
jgi:serine protease DegS